MFYAKPLFTTNNLRLYFNNIMSITRYGNIVDIKKKKKKILDK